MMTELAANVGVPDTPNISMLYFQWYRVVISVGLKAYNSFLRSFWSTFLVTTKIQLHWRQVQIASQDTGRCCIPWGPLRCIDPDGRRNSWWNWGCFRSRRGFERKWGLGARVGTLVQFKGVEVVGEGHVLECKFDAFGSEIYCFHDWHHCVEGLLWIGTLMYFVMYIGGREKLERGRYHLDLQGRSHRVCLEWEHTGQRKRVPILPQQW